MPVALQPGIIHGRIEADQSNVVSGSFKAPGNPSSKAQNGPRPKLPTLPHERFPHRGVPPGKEKDLDRPSRCRPPEDSSLADAGVVQDNNRAGRDKPGYLAHVQVPGPARRAVQHQQPRVLPGGSGFLGDQLRRKIKREETGLHAMSA